MTSMAAGERTCTSTSEDDACSHTDAASRSLSAAVASELVIATDPTGRPIDDSYFAVEESKSSEHGHVHITTVNQPGQQHQGKGSNDVRGQAGTAGSSDDEEEAKVQGEGKAVEDDGAYFVSIDERIEISTCAPFDQVRLV